MSGAPWRQLKFSVACALCALAACTRQSGEKGSNAQQPVDSGAAAHASSDNVRIHREREQVMSQGDPPLRFALDVTGQHIDSAVVRLEVRTTRDSVVYRREWASDVYLECQCSDDERPSQLPALRTDARRYLETFFDSAFIAPDPPRGRYWQAPDHRFAVRLQIVPQIWSPTGLDTGAVLDSLRAEQPTSYDSMIDRIMTGIRHRTAFFYRVGVEPHCIAAWAPEARRLLDVLCGP